MVVLSTKLGRSRFRSEILGPGAANVAKLPEWGPNVT